MAAESSKSRPSRHTVMTVSNARVFTLEKIKRLATALFTLCAVGFVFLFVPIVSYYLFGVKDMGQVFGDYFDEKNVLHPSQGSFFGPEFPVALVVCFLFSVCFILTYAVYMEGRFMWQVVGNVQMLFGLAVSSVVVAALVTGLMIMIWMVPSSEDIAPCFQHFSKRCIFTTANFGLALIILILACVLTFYIFRLHVVGLSETGFSQVKSALHQGFCESAIRLCTCKMLTAFLLLILFCILFFPVCMGSCVCIRQSSSKDQIPPMFQYCEEFK